MKSAGCVGVVAVACTALLILVHPWEPLPVGVVRDILEAMVSGRPCGALSIAGTIDPSRIQCLDIRHRGSCLRSRTSGLWIVPREVARTKALFGIPLTILRQDHSKAWLYQPKLDITFAVDDRFLVDFAKGKTTSDTLFTPIAASIPPTKPRPVSSAKSPVLRKKSIRAIQGDDRDREAGVTGVEGADGDREDEGG